MKAIETSIICNRDSMSSSIVLPLSQSSFEEPPRHNVSDEDNSLELIFRFIRKVRLFGNEYSSEAFSEEDADLLTEHPGLQIAIIKQLIKERDDQGIRTMAFLVNSQICNVPKKAIELLIDYCFSSKNSALHYEGITLIDSFPDFALCGTFKEYCFPNPFVEREWRNLKAKNGLLSESDLHKELDSKGRNTI